MRLALKKFIRKERFRLEENPQEKPETENFRQTLGDQNISRSGMFSVSSTSQNPWTISRSPGKYPD